MRTVTHKLITYPEHDEWTELFDLVKDPYELQNLADNADLMKRLRGEFETQSQAIEFRLPKLPTANNRPAAKRGRGTQSAE